MLGRFLDEHAPDEETERRADKLARAVWSQRGALDEKLAAAAKNWSVARMQIVDRSTLRLGAYEILLDEKVPPAVAINEAVEIAKDFGGEESPAFINGILDGLRQAADAAADTTASSEQNSQSSN
jgi:N utilization substance protein B